MTDNNLIYHDSSVGIIICQRRDSMIESMNKNGSYPIILHRSSLGIRFSTVGNMPKHQWQHKIIMKIFEKIGWPVKVTTNGRYYSLKNKKDRFRFKLKYGK